MKTELSLDILNKEEINLTAPVFEALEKHMKKEMAEGVEGGMSYEFFSRHLLNAADKSLVNQALVLALFFKMRELIVEAQDNNQKLNYGQAQRQAARDIRTTFANMTSYKYDEGYRNEPEEIKSNALMLCLNYGTLKNDLFLKHWKQEEPELFDERGEYIGTRK